MFEVRDHQFLVLLFVMQAKRNDGCQRCQLPLINLLQQLKDMLIDIPAVLIGLFDRRPRDEATFGSAMAFPKGVVVGVKQVRILWMKRLVIRKCR